MGDKLVRILELELAKATDILVRELVKLKPGESLLITFDIKSDWRWLWQRRGLRKLLMQRSQCSGILLHHTTVKPPIVYPELLDLAKKLGKE